jgi:hypothetical protein
VPFPVFPSIPGGPLNIISSAVTPAVMISATAILISGVSAKHASMADRLRSLTAEYRHADTTPERRGNIEKQCRLFARRLQLVGLSHRLLYGATTLFLFMVLAIGFSPFTNVSEPVLFPLFVGGIGMLLTSAVMEIMELHIGNRILSLETADALVHG